MDEPSVARQLTVSAEATASPNQSVHVSTVPEQPEAQPEAIYVSPALTSLNGNHYAATTSTMVPQALSIGMLRSTSATSTFAVSDQPVDLSAIAPLIKTYRTCATKSDLKCIQHIGHEVMTVLLKQSTSNGSVILCPKSGGQGTEYVRVMRRRSGTSARSARMYTANLQNYIAATNLSASPILCEQIVSKACSNLNAHPLFRYQRNSRKLIVLDAKDQVMLQMSGGMNDAQMIAFNLKLGQLTGFSVHERKNSLASLVDDTMPDFQVKSMSVSIEGKRVQ